MLYPHSKPSQGLLATSSFSSVAFLSFPQVFYLMTWIYNRKTCILLQECSIMHTCPPRILAKKRILKLGCRTWTMSTFIEHYMFSPRDWIRRLTDAQSGFDSKTECIWHFFRPQTTLRLFAAGLGPWVHLSNITCSVPVIGSVGWRMLNQASIPKRSAFEHFFRQKNYLRYFLAAGLGIEPR